METGAHLSFVQLFAMHYHQYQHLNATEYTSVDSRAPEPTNLPLSLAVKVVFVIPIFSRANSHSSFSKLPTYSILSVTSLSILPFLLNVRTFTGRLGNPTPTLSIESPSVRILSPSDSNSPHLLCLNISARRSFVSRTQSYR